MENRNKDRERVKQREREREVENRTALTRKTGRIPKTKYNKNNFYTNFMQRFVAGLKIKTKTKTE